MVGIEKILAPTDLSELSIVGVRYALNFAKSVGAQVTVYHVVNRTEIMDSMKDAPLTKHTAPLEKYQGELGQFIRENFSDLASSVKLHEKIEMGDPVKNIVELAKKDRTDMIILCTHGRTGLAQMLLGSVTEKVVRNSPCPVLSVHPDHKKRVAV